MKEARLYVGCTLLLAGFFGALGCSIHALVVTDWVALGLLISSAVVAIGILLFTSYD